MHLSFVIVFILPFTTFSMDSSHITELKERVRAMFQHGYSMYMTHAFPLDELRPISCNGHNTYGNYSLTLIDCLDTLMLMGYEEEFVKNIRYVTYGLELERNISVSTFETNIRVLGGLLSGYLLMKNRVKIQEQDQDGQKLLNDLLAKITWLGDTLLESFNTKTGLPYGAINLKFGVAEDELKVTCTACCGTYLVEFGVLSHLTENDTYIRVARTAAFELFNRRHEKTGLIGNHINIESGKWKFRDFGVGASIDSYFEYLLKSYILFGNPEYLRLFNFFYDRILETIYIRPWYIQVELASQRSVWFVYNSLATFWPGLQTQYGDLSRARETLDSYFGIYRRYGSTPEGFNLLFQTPQQGQKGYPLRPELIESIYYMFRATGDVKYLYMGEDMVKTLETLNKVDCGYANIKDVETHELEDKMESFFLAETLKYLYLLFDVENFVNTEKYVFNTEGHVINNDGEFWDSHKDLDDFEHELMKITDMACPFDENYGYLTKFGDW